MRVAPRLAVAVTLLTAACVREAHGGGVAWIGQIGPERAEGRVRVVGNEPFPLAIVQPEDGAAVIVTGALEGEIQRLSGADVLVTGRFVEGRLPEPTLEASSYEILSVDGDRPTLGRLERDEEGFYLAGAGGVIQRVGFVSDPLALRVGALVWVVLDELGGVARYGVLRDAS